MLDCEHWWRRPLKHLISWGEGDQAIPKGNSELNIFYLCTSPSLYLVFILVALLPPNGGSHVLLMLVISFLVLSLCVQQNVLPTWRPLCLFCALFLILKIRLLVVIQCFPVPSERTCTSLCLLGRSHMPTYLCKMLVHCAWPCSHIITKYVCYTIILCLCLASRQANIDSAPINALFRCGHYRPLFWLYSCKICLLEKFAI